MSNEVLQKCNISRAKALTIEPIRKSIYTTPNFVKNKILGEVRKDIRDSNSRALPNYLHKLFVEDFRVKSLKAIFDAEIQSRISPANVFFEVDLDLITYSQKRPSCLLDSLREAWFYYSRWLENLAIRSATAELAVGTINTESTDGEWFKSVNTVEQAIHEGILIFNGDGSSVQFVTRDFSSSQELTNIYINNFLMLSGLPEQYVFGKSSDASFINNASDTNDFFLNTSTNDLAIEWIEYLPWIADFYTFNGELW